ncbi:MAG: HepT-like ribonuclease domain-containing protein [Pseudobacter sp.]|uniref:HepT-like ribonuclease domain-containing protein n=1 Tax=Pseudobacter sp. TaxID=2045420 RepID=UPI003F80E85F
MEKYLAGVSYDEFLRNSEKRFATIKQIEIIGEACNTLTTEFKGSHSEIAWKPIRGFRNISIHEYFAVNFHLVWEIALNDLPVLKVQFQEALDSLPSE